MKTIILRHRRENLHKCSLRGLEKRDDLAFYTYPIHQLPDLSNYLVLQVGAPPLTIEDRDHGVLLIDGTWRLAEVMAKQLPLNIKTRSLPSHFKTAYPRTPNPESGLASVEALFIAHRILERSTENLLDHYYWKDIFMKINDL